MSVVTFCSEESGENGKTMSAVAIATNMAISHNMKILLISTGYNVENLNRCFWYEKKSNNSLGGLLMGDVNQASTFEDQVSGLIRTLDSNKLTPELITDYTDIVFKDRLGVLKSFKGSHNEYKKLEEKYVQIIKLANQYYDIVIVDLDNAVNPDSRREILDASDVIMINVEQKLSKIDSFKEIRMKRKSLNTKNTLILIGKYDTKSKYNIPNITRYLGEKNKVSAVPYNTLYMEAAEEGKVAELFLKLKRLNPSDENGEFMNYVNKTTENIMYRIQDLQMKM